MIVPCLDEELNLPELTRRVLRTFEVGGLAGELVLVDDVEDVELELAAAGPLEEEPVVAEAAGGGATGDRTSRATTWSASTSATPRPRPRRC